MTANPPGIVPARSRQQAMDWSLVLASQGIEASINGPDDTNGWHLVVERHEYPRALRTLREYHRENRERRWLQKVPGTDLVFDGRSVVWLALLGAIYAIDVAESGHLRTMGMVDTAAIRGGEWWRLFTAVMLHGDVAHLAANVTTGFVLLGLAMGTLGPGLGLLGSYLAGVAGNVAGLFLYGEPHRGLGASGMVLGALGLLAAQSLVFWRGGVAGRQMILRGLFGGLMLLVLLGMSPDPRTDVVAHVAGFAGGAILGSALAALPAPFRRNAWVQRGAVLAGTGAVLLTWGLALRP